MKARKLTEEDKQTAAASEAIDWWLSTENVAEWASTLDIPDDVLDCLALHIRRVAKNAYERAALEAAKEPKR